jgi:serine/threonine protein kinase
VKVLDFGIAWARWWTPLTESSEVTGTAPYLSPEQVRGEVVDSRSDVYSLGVVLFEMLSGRPPFAGDNPLAVARRHLEEPPPSVRELNPEVPAELADVVVRCLAKRPDDRYASARTLAAELRRVAVGNPTPSATLALPRPEPTAVLWRDSARTRSPWRRGAVAMVMVLVAALVWSTLGGLLTKHSRASAAPAVPLGLSASPRCDGLLQYAVQLQWRPSPSADGYLLLRRSATGGRYEVAARLRGRRSFSVKDGGLERATLYEYGVRAFRGGRLSGLSRTVLVTTNSFCF